MATYAYEVNGSANTYFFYTKSALGLDIFGTWTNTEIVMNLPSLKTDYATALYKEVIYPGPNINAIWAISSYIYPTTRS